MGQLSRWVLGVLLCLTISSTPGSSADSVDPATLITTSVALAIEITNVGFNASLQNRESEYSKMLDAEVETLLDGIYKCEACPTKLFYEGVECINYSHGLIANASIIFNTTSIDPSIVRALFTIYLAEALPQTSLNVNEEYTSDSKPVILDEDVCKKTTTTPEPTTTPKTITSPKPTSTPKPSSNPEPTTTPSTPEPTSTPSTPQPPPTPEPTSIPEPTKTTGLIMTPDPSKTPDPTNAPDPTVTSDPTRSGGTSGPSSGGGNRDDRDWVPGWGIALLVLAAAILLLLIILFILLCIRFCRKRPSEDPMGKNPDPYYDENKMPPQETVPVYYPSAPITAPSSPMQTEMVVGDTPKKNRTGFYALNP
ncbi:uncharacterized protein LOC132451294 isoform X1 [Gadus macrocephalus]|uniref:uncharacterized protein LOC132451294 isoform X1 n=1 Tax=Gadus macrocephalus TaxID=80720 RepID=UPI0028CB6EE6|nr:uncharacterized protein LOC132451294 isoform X1 [Gadus macrocephalus]